MFKKLLNRIFQSKVKEDNSWYADYKMEDGRTGRVWSTFEVDAVERIAFKCNHKSLWWSVKGGEWFNGFSYSGK